MGPRVVRCAVFLGHKKTEVLEHFGFFNSANNSKIKRRHVAPQIITVS